MQAPLSSTSTCINQGVRRCQVYHGNSWAEGYVNPFRDPNVHFGESYVSCTAVDFGLRGAWRVMAEPHICAPSHRRGFVVVVPNRLHVGPGNPCPHDEPVSGVPRLPLYVHTCQDVALQVE